ncbi:unnamed protein product [Sphagnum balticum]
MVMDDAVSKIKFGIESFDDRKDFVSFGNLDDIICDDTNGFCVDGIHTLRPEFSNLALFASTGMGKSTTAFLGQLYRTNGPTIFVFDPSATLFGLTAHRFARLGYKIHNIDYSNILNSSGLNFVDCIKCDEDANRLAAHLVRGSLGGSKSDPFFNISAASLLAFLFKLILRMDIKYRNMANMMHLLNAFNVRVKKSPDAQPTPILNPLAVRFCTDAMFSEYKNLISNQSEKTMGSILLTCKASLEFFSSDALCRVSADMAMSRELSELFGKRNVVGKDGKRSSEYLMDASEIVRMQRDSGLLVVRNVPYKLNLRPCGALDKGDEAIALARREYWRQYDREYKAQRRSKNKEHVVNLEPKEYEIISEGAKKHSLSIPVFLKMASLAYLNHTYVSPESASVRKIEAVLVRCLTAIERISSRKEKKGGRLLAYILRDSAVARDQEGKPYVIRHNVFGTPAEVEHQLRDNNGRRLHARSNSNHFIHTIISLSEKDKEHVTPEMLEELSRKYIELLNPNGLYYGTFHLQENPHAHLISSGSDLEGRALRVSKEEYKHIKIELESFQEREYGILKNSIVDHAQEARTKSDKEWQIGNAGRVSRKDEIKQIISSSFELATSREEFFNLLREDLKTYDRGGETVGIEDINNFRFKTLGVDLAELDTRESRLKELENIGTDREQGREESEEKEMTIEQQRMKELEELDRAEAFRT